jgi:uncharacterized protein YgiB involved in biofilm formation
MLAYSILSGIGFFRLTFSDDTEDEDFTLYTDPDSCRKKNEKKQMTDEVSSGQAGYFANLSYF